MPDNWWDIDSENIVIEPALHKCSECIYWTGNPGTVADDLVCAVNIPKPSSVELEWVDGRKGYARHNCPDFESK